MKNDNWQDQHVVEVHQTQLYILFCDQVVNLVFHEDTTSTPALRIVIVIEEEEPF